MILFRLCPKKALGTHPAAGALAERFSIAKKSILALF